MTDDTGGCKRVRIIVVYPSAGYESSDDGSSLPDRSGGPVTGGIVNEKAVVSLIKDLTAKLSAVAEEFSGRADEVDEPNGGSAPVERSLAEKARMLSDQRRLRRRALPPELFHEPAWDMLLALYLAHGDSRVLNVKSLVACADAPVTTSQRWIEHLHKLRLVTRVVDPIDRRRLEVSLSPAGVEAMEKYLSSLP